MYKVTLRLRQGKKPLGEKSKVLDANQLAGFCVEVCGGGYNTAQVTEAMCMQSKLLDGKPFRINIAAGVMNVTLEHVEQES